MAAMTLLCTEGLSRQFGGLRAVDDVDFSLPPLGVHAIIGPNGAGKTTFVNLVSGRLRPTHGRVVFDGEDITSLPAHRRVQRGIAYTFQITSVFGNLSVWDNVALAVQSRRGAVRKRGPVHGMAADVDQALQRVGIAERHRAKAGELAYGHQRLLEIAMGLALSPKLLILDEPTQGLSDPEIAGFCDLVVNIARDATVLLIEHNMAVVMRLADRITVMEGGKILAEGTPEAIKANEAVQQAYLGA